MIELVEIADTTAAPPDTHEVYVKPTEQQYIPSDFITSIVFNDKIIPVYEGPHTLESVDPHIGVATEVAPGLYVRARIVTPGEEGAEYVSVIRAKGYEQYGKESATEKSDLTSHDPNRSIIILVEETSSHSSRIY